MVSLPAPPLIEMFIASLLFSMVSSPPSAFIVTPLKVLLIVSLFSVPVISNGFL